MLRARRVWSECSVTSSIQRRSAHSTSSHASCQRWHATPLSPHATPLHSTPLRSTPLHSAQPCSSQPSLLSSRPTRRQPRLHCLILRSGQYALCYPPLRLVDPSARCRRCPLRRLQARLCRLPLLRPACAQPLRLVARRLHTQSALCLRCHSRRPLRAVTAALPLRSLAAAVCSLVSLPLLSAHTALAPLRRLSPPLLSPDHRCSVRLCHWLFPSAVPLLLRAALLPRPAVLCASRALLSASASAFRSSERPPLVSQQRLVARSQARLLRRAGRTARRGQGRAEEGLLRTGQEVPPGHGAGRQGGGGGEVRRGKQRVRSAERRRAAAEV